MQHQLNFPSIYEFDHRLDILVSNWIEFNQYFKQDIVYFMNIRNICD